MFFDSGAWPPPTGGDDPPAPGAPRLTRGQERKMMRLIGMMLLLMLVGPLAGSSVVVGLLALLG